MDSRMIDPVQAAAAMLFTIQPTDRALAGWDPGYRRNLASCTVAQLAAYLMGDDDE